MSQLLISTSNLKTKGHRAPNTPTTVLQEIDKLKKDKEALTKEVTELKRQNEEFRSAVYGDQEVGDHEGSLSALKDSRCNNGISTMGEGGTYCHTVYHCHTVSHCVTLSHSHCVTLTLLQLTLLLCHTVSHVLFYSIVLCGGWM